MVLICKNFIKFRQNWPSSSAEEDFLILSMYFRYFVIISPWKIAGSFIWTNLNSLHSKKEGIHICSIDGLRPSPRGNNYETGKIHWRNLKRNSPESLDQFEPNWRKTLLGEWRFKCAQMNGPALYQWEVISIEQNNIDEI